MDKTLLRYAELHYKQHNHRTTIYGNFTECDICGDHAHYYNINKIIHHDAAYNVYEFILLN